MVLMMNHPIDDLRILARAYLEARPGMAASSLSRIVSGVKNNDKLIARIIDGKGCTMALGERASRFFEDHWPDNTPWPSNVPRYNRQCAHAAE
jgi:hypothetical protein